VLSYFDWNDYADLLADAMAERDIGPGDVIAMLCRNRMEWAVVALAAAKLDARLLPLPADLAGHELRQRLIGGRVSAIIIGDCDPAAVSKALVGVPLLLRATMDEAHPGFFSFWDLFGPAAPPRFGHAQPSVIAWTEGKRGPAKGVAIPRRRAAPASVSRPPQPEHGCSLITVPLYRTWGGVQFWAALAAGRTIALMRRFDALRAVELLTGGGITHWNGLPESFQKLSALPAELFEKSALRSLKEVVVGGAAVSPPLKSWIMATFGDVVCEAYGSTEAGLIAFMPAGRNGERPGSCGRAGRGVLIEIRDANGAVLPRDSVGEIWARTPRTLSADFIGYPRTRSRRDEQGFVATGDTGWLDENGYLYISRAAPPLELSAPDLSPKGVRRAG
jgi:acyl-CoA synthetase (AMP-forming)/AMP-acid ligase II